MDKFEAPISETVHHPDRQEDDMAKQFKAFCVKQQTGYKELLRKLTDLGIFLEATNKRMSKGMKIVSPAVRVLKFDTSADETLRVEAILGTDENRDSSVQN